MSMRRGWGWLVDPIPRSLPQFAREYPPRRRLSTSIPSPFFVIIVSNNSIRLIVGVRINVISGRRY